MGLYINGDYEDIYQTDEAVDDNNQVIYFHNRTAERLEEQMQFNESIEKHVAEIKSSTDRQHVLNMQKWQEFETEYRRLLTNLAAISEKNERLANQVTAYMERQEEITNQLAIDKNRMKGLEKRVEEQEAITAKVVRQLDHFRSVLYERTNYLAEKVEEATASIIRFIKNEQYTSSTKEKEKAIR